MTLRSVRSLAIVACALLGAGLWTARPADARTYSHGKSVFFSDATFGDGDVILGDLNVVFGDVTCGDGAEITGNVNTAFGNFEQLGSCKVDGTVNDAFNNAPVGGFAPWMVPSVGAAALVAENRQLVSHLVYGVIVLFIFLLFPLRVRVALERVEKHPGLSATVGTIALVAVIPVAILLALSIIGIPLVVVEIAALLAAIGIGQGAVSILIGRRLFELLRPHTTPSPLGALVLGLVVVSAAEILPGVGWAVTTLVLLVGLGAAILGFMRETAFQNFTHSHTAGMPPGNVPPSAPPPGTAAMRP